MLFSSFVWADAGGGALALSVEHSKSGFAILTVVDSLQVARLVIARLARGEAWTLPLCTLCIPLVGPCGATGQ